MDERRNVDNLNVHWCCMWFGQDGRLHENDLRKGWHVTRPIGGGTAMHRGRQRRTTWTAGTSDTGRASPLRAHHAAKNIEYKLVRSFSTTLTTFCPNRGERSDLQWTYNVDEHVRMYATNSYSNRMRNDIFVWNRRDYKCTAYIRVTRYILKTTWKTNRRII